VTCVRVSESRKGRKIGRGTPRHSIIHPSLHPRQPPAPKQKKGSKRREALHMARRCSRRVGLIDGYGGCARWLMNGKHTHTTDRRSGSRRQKSGSTGQTGPKSDVRLRFFATRAGHVGAYVLGATPHRAVRGRVTFRGPRICPTTSVTCGDIGKEKNWERQACRSRMSKSGSNFGTSNQGDVVGVSSGQVLDGPPQ
jgi:hypothetical protein